MQGWAHKVSLGGSECMSPQAKRYYMSSDPSFRHISGPFTLEDFREIAHLVKVSVRLYDEQGSLKGWLHPNGECSFDDEKQSGA